MKAADKGSINLKTKLITYVALPCPLPQAWRDEFINCAKNNKGDYAALHALEVRCREAIGFQVTREYIPPVKRDILPAIAQ